MDKPENIRACRVVGCEYKLEDAAIRLNLLLERKEFQRNQLVALLGVEGFHNPLDKVGLRHSLGNFRVTKGVDPGGFGKYGLAIHLGMTGEPAPERVTFSFAAPLVVRLAHLGDRDQFPVEQTRYHAVFSRRISNPIACPGHLAPLPTGRRVMPVRSYNGACQGRRFRNSRRGVFAVSFQKSQGLAVLASLVASHEFVTFVFH